MDRNRHASPRLEDERDVLAINVRMIRLRLQLTQLDFAQKAGVSLRAVDEMESFKRTRCSARFSTLQALAASLQIPVRALLEPPPPDWEDQLAELMHKMRSARALQGWRRLRS